MTSRHLAGFLAALLISISCHATDFRIPGAGGTSFSLSVRNLKEMRFKNTVRQQYDFSCGSAAVATLLTYQYGYRVTEEEAFQEMYANGDQEKIRQEGFSLLDVKRFLKNRGFEANGFEARLEDLAAAGLPAIAMISENGYQHFVVIKGIRQGRVLFSDPAVGDRIMAQARFEQLWQHSPLFVIQSHQELAKFNHPAEWNAVPTGPMKVGVPRDSVLPMQRLGPGEF